jgi:hypothetical protein
VPRFTVDAVAFAITIHLILQELNVKQLQWQPVASAGLSLLGALWITLFHLCRSKAEAEVEGEKKGEEEAAQALADLDLGGDDY